MRIVGPVGCFLSIDVDIAWLFNREEDRLPSTLLKHPLVAAFTSIDGKQRAFCGVRLREEGCGELAILIGFTVALVLIKCAFAVGTRDNPKHEGRRFGFQMRKRRIAGNDAAQADEVGNLVQPVLVRDSLVPWAYPVAAHIKPQTFRQPSLSFARAVAA